MIIILCIYHKKSTEKALRLYFWTEEIHAAIFIVSINTCATKERGSILHAILLLHSQRYCSLHCFGTLSLGILSPVFRQLVHQFVPGS